MQILGASFDDQEANAAFARKFGFDFPLLCDTDRKLGLAYGAADDPGAATARRISYLIDLSVVAPMLGLLGTVLGMLEAFFVLPKESASVTSKNLAAAIGGAMTATFFGLVVAIMAVVFHSIIKSRTLRALSESEQVVHSIADYIKRGDA